MASISPPAAIIAMAQAWTRLTFSPNRMMIAIVPAIINAIRRFSDSRGFLEVDTPILHTLEIGAALGVACGGKDPALAAIEQRNRAAAPMPAAVRERLNQIKKGA